MLYELLKDIFNKYKNHKITFWVAVIVGALSGLYGDIKASAKIPNHHFGIGVIIGSGLGFICYFIMLAFDALGKIWDRRNSLIAHILQVILFMFLGIVFFGVLCAAILLILKLVH